MADIATRKKGSLIGRLGTFLLLAVVFAILVSLGTWQMQRLYWKESLLTAIAERRSAPPVTLAEIEKILAGGGDIDYRTVSVTGTFDHSKERHFFATYNGRTGYYVFTPLTLDDGRILFVNRGFVPFEQKDSSTRLAGELPAFVGIHGLARPKLDQKPSSLVPDNDLAKNIFYWKDLDTMASSVGLPADKVIPFFVDADATPNPGGLPIGGVTQFDLPNNHLQYALTWYGLAGALVLVSGIYALRRGR
ncbi:MULTISPECIES: SURF1 family protein [unclassified Ensifer]|uniref:SURF1 family protein n=1 Tax=unclassified Ensifer TaxID=2633371 RepID=UPI0008131736|nr:MULTISPECIES: SURF1 family protein [unclassified Ensifer]OCO99825.1 cytochrome c oxidase assembly protein [Ensifer sp. LC14]OCP06093.1 cytochrome c oxidase assembly protein [Ensifer sp. LC11]OCP07042.1 cytochrome c oxidase assembly protein [Ensifer sp. LC13]OCP31504.1 cytochrome c oxidase assembly protein [Ensifer sp. LC499]